ncbi:M50 family metallopeptidase [Actinomycetospora flava]|uniref:M50 family metallopeptidase n=1 Tax=Actinomycetospora flava TaxID=3129232 RepID=A0ABU8LZX8_9PSEU
MGVGLGVNDVPIVGEPVAFGAGFIALLFVCFSTYIARYFYFYAATGGSLLTLVGLAQPIGGYAIDEKGLVFGRLVVGGRGLPVVVLAYIAGYIGPPLLGVAGAALIAAGNPWAVLLGTTFLSLLALLVAGNPLGFTIPLLIVLGLGAALFYGSGDQQAFAAAFVVWFLLFGGIAGAFRASGLGGERNTLAGRTFIPAVVWQLLFISVAIVSLIVGGQLLLRPGYDVV